MIHPTRVSMPMALGSCIWRLHPFETCFSDSLSYKNSWTHLRLYGQSQYTELNDALQVWDRTDKARSRAQCAISSGLRRLACLIGIGPKPIVLVDAVRGYFKRIKKMKFLNNHLMSKSLAWLMAWLLGVLLAGCGGGGGGSGGSATGTLSVSLTDAPACGFDAVNVTVIKVRVHQSSSASDTDAGWTDITLNPARKINLLNLTNGVLDKLGETPLSAGHYTQLRLVLDTSVALFNSVVPSTPGGVETALVTPSGSQS